MKKTSKTTGKTEIIPCVNVKIKLDTKAKVPSYAKEGDVGLDLTCIDIEYQDDLIVYKTGVYIEIPKGYFGFIVPRSSIGKKDLMLTNHAGIIDSGYRGELLLKYRATKTGNIRDYEIGDRVGQLIILKHPFVTFVEVDELTQTQRGQHGFGSTGK